MDKGKEDKGQGKGKEMDVCQEVKPRQSCMFGYSCMKTEFDHKQQFAHPGDDDFDHVTAAGQMRPSCRFGNDCRNTTQEHWNMFAHPADKDYVQHQPKDDGVPDTALRFEGEISYYQRTGDWGFIRCTALSGMLGMNEAEGKPKDLYFTKKNSNAKQLSVGQNVTFVLKETNVNGKPEAIRIETVPLPEDPPDAIRYHGIVSSFIKDATWGFITCPMAKVGQDIWFHLKDCAGARVWLGMTVTFLLDEKRRPGKPEGISVKPALSSEDPPGFERIGGEVTRLIGESAKGTEKGTKETEKGKGKDIDKSPYGFIKGEADETMHDKLRELVHNKDFFFHQRDCMGAGRVYEGAKVTFLLDERSQMGTKPHAIRVKMVDPFSGPEYKGGGKGACKDGGKDSAKDGGKGCSWWEEEEKEINPYEMMGMMMKVMNMLKGKGKGEDTYGKSKSKGCGGDDWGSDDRGSGPYSKGKGGHEQAPAPAPVPIHNVPLGLRVMHKKV